MTYTPSPKILENYANVLINFALNSGKGVKKGETVYLLISESAKPFLPHLRNTITKAGAHIILRYIPEDEGRYQFAKDFYRLAQSHQLTHVPDTYFQGIVDEVDHVVTILSDNPHVLAGVDSKKLSIHTNALATLRSKYSAKEDQGKLTWTLALYGTPERAKEAGMSEKAYWDQIISACFLDKKNPVAEWKKTMARVESVRKKLTSLNIDWVHVEGPDVDLRVRVGEKRKWMGCNGRNIPSFEIFCSPDWKGTEGYIRFNQPLYYLGSRITGIELWFEKGCVVKMKAKTGEKLLREMISTKNAEKVGEFSLTDRRVSRITKFMAHTLFDENMGGPNGNTHIALGNAYKDGYNGDVKKVRPAEWKRLGFNESIVHTDMFSTTPRVVTAYLKDGKKKVIYKNGQFMV